MSAMPPVDNYITYFYWKTLTGPRYYNGMGISRPNVEMNCNDIFMRHLWSTWNAKVIAIRSVASDCLTKITNGRTKCDTKTAQISKKNRFYN